jgi:alkanesulfonate monooxygenase SsuD/methylene tetrahydromethanopterin reductase-like flavin-dependent oxidoreductase (luciferase family)
MEVGLHLPQVDLSGEGLAWRRLADAVDAAVELGISAVCVNDHLLYPRPWLDGPTALAAVVDRSAELTLMTSVALPTVRGPVPVAKALAALDLLSGGRLIAGLGTGSSDADYAAVGVPFEQRWRRFDEAVPLLRALLRDDAAPAGGTFYPVPSAPLAPLPPLPPVPPLPPGPGGVPLWIASWGSAAGLRRVARLGDGWLASAYNTDPQLFAGHLEQLGEELERLGRPGSGFPHALVTMWTWITGSGSEAERVVTEVVAPLVRRDPASLRGRVCVGSASMCAELLSRYVRAGCRQVHFWPVADERRQLELIVTEVLPRTAV